MKRIYLDVKRLDKEAFLPYGYVLQPDKGLPLIKKDEPQFLDRIPFSLIDGEPEFVYARLERRPLIFHEMERHIQVAQGFFPVSSSSAIMVVAPPTSNNDLEAIPPPNTIKAFYLDRSTPVVLHHGTWHGAILPLEPKFDYILATRKQTTDGSIEPSYDGDVQIRNLGVEFEIKF